MMELFSRVDKQAEIVHSRDQVLQCMTVHLLLMYIAQLHQAFAIYGQRVGNNAERSFAVPEIWLLFLKCCVLTCNVVSSFCKVCVFLSSSMGLTAARVVEKKPLTILSSSFTRPLKCNPLSLSSATQRKKKQSECLTGRAFKCGNNKSAGTTVPHDS